MTSSWGSNILRNSGISRGMGFGYLEKKKVMGQIFSLTVCDTETSGIDGRVDKTLEPQKQEQSDQGTTATATDYHCG